MIGPLLYNGIMDPAFSPKANRENARNDKDERIERAYAALLWALQVFLSRSRGSKKPASAKNIPRTNKAMRD